MCYVYLQCCVIMYQVQTDPEEVKQRDLWVTDFVPMQNIYKLALALTSKEIGKSLQYCIYSGHASVNIWHITRS